MVAISVAAVVVFVVNVSNILFQMLKKIHCLLTLKFVEVHTK